MDLKERNLNIDIIKCIALFFVVCGHYYLYSNFYNLPVNGIRMFILVILRSLFVACIPIFLMISGYLLYKKDITADISSYYNKLKKILLPYFIISIFTAVAITISAKYGNNFYNGNINLLDFIKSFFNFNLIGYSWYYEMYIGLFLIIPFINKMLTNFKNDTILLIILIILTIIPAASKGESILLDFWKNLWPITYYILGAYIAKYNLKINTKLNIIYFICSFLIIGLFNFYITRGREFTLQIFDIHNNPENLFIAFFFFLLFINMKIEIKNEYTKRLITNIAKLSLSIYLFYYICDKIIYFYFNKLINYASVKIEYFIIVVPLIFICSVIMANFENWIEILLSKIKFR